MTISHVTKTLYKPKSPYMEARRRLYGEHEWMFKEKDPLS